MTKKFAELTALIPKIKDWMIENEGITEEQPFWYHHEVENEFIKTLSHFGETHPEFEYTRYGETLKEHGIEWGETSMEEADVSGMDAKGVIALLTGAFRADHFCYGELLIFFEKGCILRWLERLNEIDNR